MALWLSFPAAGMASRQQDPAGSTNAAGQAPAAPAPAENAPAEKSRTEPAPAEQVPAENTPTRATNPETPAAEKKAPEGVAKEKSDAGSASASSARGSAKPRQGTGSVPDGGPRKIVVREGGASEPAARIAPGMPPAEATRERKHAEKLLGSTDDQVKQLALRTLDARQQETVGQIRNYMDGARSALKEGDVRRASTLAEKAHLLAEDLVKH